VPIVSVILVRLVHVTEHVCAIVHRLAVTRLLRHAV